MFQQDVVSLEDSYGMRASIFTSLANGADLFVLTVLDTGSIPSSHLAGSQENRSEVPKQKGLSQNSSFLRFQMLLILPLW